MHLRYCVAVGALFAICGPQASPGPPSTTSQTVNVTYNLRLKVKSKADLQLRLARPFQVGMAHPRGVNTCREFLASVKSKEAILPSLSGPELSTLADCMVIGALFSAVPPRVSRFQDLAWSPTVLSLLPPGLAIAVSKEAEKAAETADQDGKTWKEFDASIEADEDSKGPDEIVVSGSGFVQRLVLWGRGDFTGQGNDELLVESYDALTEGTYRNVRVFLLGRDTNEGGLRIVTILLEA